MRDHDERALPVQQRLLQPLDGFQVEVVGRLVQQQQIRLLEQQLRQQCARALAAAQMRQLLAVLILVEAQPAEHLADAHLVVIAAGHLEGGLRMAILVEQRGDSRHRRAARPRPGDAPTRPARRPGRAAGRRRVSIASCRVIVASRWRVLRQIADRQPALANDIAAGRWLGAGQNAQQGGLARAVRADHADAVACFDAEIHAAKTSSAPYALLRPDAIRRDMPRLLQTGAL